MRRALAFVGVVFFTIQMIATAVPQTFLWWSAALFLLLAFAVNHIHFTKNNPYIKTFTIVAFAAITYHLAFTALFVAPLQQYEGETVQVEAVVLSAEPGYTDGYTNAEVSVTRLGGKRPAVPLKAAITALPDCAPGDVVCFTATGQQAKTASLSQGLFFAATYSSGFSVTGQRTTPAVFFARLRAACAANIRALLPGDSGALLCAMAVGQRSYLTTTQTDAFRRAGAAHILVVSGLHLSVFSGAVYFLFHRRKRLAAVVSSCATMGFMLLAGMTPSIVRAGVSLLVVYTGILLQEQSDTLTSLGFAALLLCVQNPFAAMNAGLLLSFTATLGVLATLDLRESWLWHHTGANATQRKLLQIGMLVAVPLCVSLATMPIMALFGLPYSLGTFLCAVVVLPLLTPVLICGMVVAFLGGVPMLAPLTNGCGLIAGLLLRFMQAFASALAFVPFFVYRIGGVYFFAATGCLLLAAFILWHKKVRYGVAVFAGMVVLAFAAYAALDEGVTHIAITGTAQNAAVVLWQQDKTVVILQSAGQAEAILAAMEENNRFTIDTLVDMRTATATPLPASLAAHKTITVQKDLQNSGIYPVTFDTILYIKHQAHGNVVCVDIGGYKVLLCKGTTDVTPYTAVDVYIAGANTPKGLTAAQTVFAAPPDEKDTAATVCTGISVRSGASAIMKGE